MASRSVSATLPEAVGPRYAAAPVKTKSPSSAPKERKKTDPQTESAGGEGDAGEALAAGPGELRRGPLTALLGLLALGLVVATYMTVAHLELFHGTGSFKSICNFGARLDCDAVNTSDQSEIRGVGIAVFALPAYAMLAFLVQRARSSRRKSARVAVALAHALAWPTVAYSAYLFFVMAFQLRTFCLFCLTLDTVNVAAVVLTAVAARETPRALLSRAWTALDGPGKRIMLITGGLGGAVLAFALGGHAWLRASLEAEARAAVISTPASSATGAGSAAGAGEADDPQAVIDDLLQKAGPRKLPTKRWQVPVDDDDASVGPKDAPVTIVQFADFQCSFCRKLEQSMAAIRKTYATEVRFVFKHFPMSPRCNPTVRNEKHSHACDAAAAAECARRQGKFWPMHDMLYDRQTHLERSSLDTDATDVGLDPAAFTACMDDASVSAAIAKDSTEGAAIKVNGTPRTFINGKMFSGVLSEDLLDFVIRIELGQVTGKEAESYAPKPAASP